MTLRHRKMLAKILDRIAEPSDDVHAAFTFEEVRLWPTGAVETLVAGRFLKEGMRVDDITCHGCERRCLRPVMLIEAGADRASTFISTCHLRADMGPFEHLAERLMRWTCSREGVARFIGRNWRVQIQDYDNRWRRVRFGTVQLAGVRRLLSIEFKGTAIAKIGSLPIPLIELLEWNEAKINVSLETLGHYASQGDDALSGSKRVQPSTTIRDDNKQLTLLKTRRLQGRLDTLVREHPKLTKEQLVRKLVKADMGEGSTVPRIMRITRMPQKISRRKNIA